MKYSTVLVTLLLFYSGFVYAKNAVDYEISSMSQHAPVLQDISAVADEQVLDELEQHLEAIIRCCQGATGQRIYSIIKRLNNPACPEKLKPRKLLIVGPSGVGKTTLARCIAHAIKRPCKFIQATDLLTKYQHSGSENLLREVRSILNERKPYVIVIDEMSCLLDNFNNKHNQDKETATALWLALDECCAREDILFIGTMNEVESIPGPIETRFKNHTIEIPLPSYAARRTILLYFLNSFEHELSRSQLRTICKQTEGFSGRELEELVTQALNYAYERHSTMTYITAKDMLRALNTIRPHGALVTQLRYIFSHKRELLTKAMPYIFPALLSLVGFAFQYYMWRWQQQPFHEQGLQAQQEIAKAEKEATRLQNEQLKVQKECNEVQQKQLNVASNTYILHDKNVKTHEEMLKITKDYRDMKTLALKYKKVIGWLLIEQDRMAFRSKMHQLGMCKEQELKDTLNTCFTGLTDNINMFNTIGKHMDRYYDEYVKRNDLTDSTVAQKTK